MEVLVDYAYTRKAVISADNVQDAMIAADMFCMIGLLNAAVDFMRDHIDPENSIEVHRFADAIGIPELKFYALKYLLQNFADIRKTVSFGNLSMEELVSLLQHDMLNVSKEEEAWDSIGKRIFHIPTGHLLDIQTTFRLSQKNVCARMVSE